MEANIKSDIDEKFRDEIDFGFIADSFQSCLISFCNYCFYIFSLLADCVRVAVSDLALMVSEPLRQLASTKWGSLRSLSIKLEFIGKLRHCGARHGPIRLHWWYWTGTR